MPAPVEQEGTVALGPGLLHAEFFRVRGILLARIVGASGAAHYFAPARAAIKAMPPDLDRLTDAMLANQAKPEP